ncbi:NAD(P)-dependent alcohol dehydrogenase [Roseivivax isoporae]|uniref:Hydroxyacid dehydrogenase n=1 Tax=Roseivivax isoporae LMG 25204 TaxID=1449351 RepID=X7FAR6_9RHOB|nr:NAD(P)-dependent alcohol dehydrogenase [Roseivivax isoporae]ETX29813.1 hydroxyacid dehydrogenase [Roseivivax isoporae LMG 25204]
MKVTGYGTTAADRDLVPVTFDRAEPRAGEVEIEITHCGMCHSDLHQVRDDWGNTIFPCVPGHEIVGVVRKAGRDVTKFAEGDRVGVGCMVDSCQDCPECRAGDEQYCSGPHSCTMTYNGTKIPSGINTYGGYTSRIVVREEFVLRIPEGLRSEAAAPILCAGITVYNPMKHFGLKTGQRLAVAGVGGLGHMAIKIGKALGAEVIALTRSLDKAEEIRGFGADRVVSSQDPDAMAELAGSVDMMINTIPVAFDVAPYISLMRHDGNLCIVGNMIELEAFSPGPLVFNRITLSGSLIGGIAETQEVLDLCAAHGIEPAIETVGARDINDVLATLEKGGAGHFRHVIDMSTLADTGATPIADPVRDHALAAE